MFNRTLLWLTSASRRLACHGDLGVNAHRATLTDRSVLSSRSVMVSI
ncbi:hypothetical protein ACLK1T_07195 [Escherichia coli]